MSHFFLTADPVFQALMATICTWLVTAFGASLVFLFKSMNRKWLDGMLGFSGGIMIAASYWSLLEPSVNLSEAQGNIAWLPPVLGFLTGALFLFGMDRMMPHLHINFSESEKEGLDMGWHRTTLLVLAITLHNIPEGLAVGVAIGAVGYGLPGADMGAAVALAIGIGLQNFPEGVAVAMPLRRMGMSRIKSFWYGQLSGLVEPVFGVVGAASVLFFQPVLPYALAFAAGAMIYVVVEEVIPESQRAKYYDITTLGFIGGFALMMVLDIALG